MSGENALTKKRAAPQGARDGFYRRGCQEKILFPWRQRGVVLWHPAPVDAGMGSVAAGFSGFLFHVTASFGCCTLRKPHGGSMANHGSIGDSPARGGTIALLGCPREHMVARETWV